MSKTSKTKGTRKIILRKIDEKNWSIGLFYVGCCVAEEVHVFARKEDCMISADH